MGRTNKKKSTKKRTESSTTYRGRIEVTRSGMGFVIVDGLDADVLVRPGDFNTAMHGDTVLVRLAPQRDGRRAQGVIAEVVERKQSDFVGRLQMNKGFAFFVGDSDKRIPDIYIPQSNFNGAKDADRVVVRITEWGTGAGKRPIGEVVSVLQAENENDISTLR